jgi:hypothetical protein
VDQLRIIAYPFIAGEGKALFVTTECRPGSNYGRFSSFKVGV